MLSMIRRDFTAIPLFLYCLFLIFGFIFIHLQWGLLLSAAIITLLIFATFLSAERYRHVEQFFVSLPVSRFQLVLGRYINVAIVLSSSFTILLIMQIIFKPLNGNLYIPTGKEIYVLLCSLLILFALSVPYSFIFSSYKITLAFIAVQFVIVTFIFSKRMLQHLFTTRIETETNTESVFFTYERYAWDFEFSLLIEHNVSLTVLTIVTIATVIGSIALSYRLYKHKRIG